MKGVFTSVPITENNLAFWKEKKKKHHKACDRQEKVLSEEMQQSSELRLRSRLRYDISMWKLLNR